MLDPSAVFICLSIFRVVCRQVETGVGVELLEFDLGFEAFLSFHYYVHQFVPVGVPFFDAAQITGAALVVDDEGHHIVANLLFVLVRRAVVRIMG